MHARMLIPMLLAASLASGCFGGGGEDAADAPTTPTPAGGADASAMDVTSAAFEDQGAIPTRHTCDGEGTSPPLSVTGVPANASSLAMSVLDPDAPVPEAPALTVVHWLIWNLNATGGTLMLAEGEVPEGAVQGANTGGENAWMGPCPPPASNPHRYVFTVYALIAPLDLQEGADRDAFEAALEGHVLAQATLTGTYGREAPALRR